MFYCCIHQFDNAKTTPLGNIANHYKVEHYYSAYFFTHNAVSRITSHCSYLPVQRSSRQPTTTRNELKMAKPILHNKAVKQ